MILECDQKAKEERRKCIRETRENNGLLVGNVEFKCGNEMLEKLVSEVIKWKDSDSKCEECIHHKHVEQWDLVDIDARNVFTSYAPSMIKCILGLNQHGERIKCINMINKTAVCPLCGKIEYLNRILLCKNNRNNRREWLKRLLIILKSIEHHKNANEEERGIVKEISNDANKFFLIIVMIISKISSWLDAEIYVEGL